jgi:hypothetical protein
MTDVATLQRPTDRYGLRHLLGGELIKVVTLRSTLWTLLVTLVGSVGITVLSVHSVTHNFSFDPTNQALAGLTLAVLAIGIFGALTVTGEYGTGTMRATLAAAPRRPLLLAAKVLVVGALALVLGEVISFTCFGVGQAVLASGGVNTAALGQPGVLRAVAGSGVFLALFGLMGLGLGVIIRHTAGALAAFVGVSFLLPFVLQRMPDNPQRFTPLFMLANSVAAVARSRGQVNAPEGLGLMAAYTAAILAVGAVVLVRRDA